MQSALHSYANNLTACKWSVVYQQNSSPDVGDHSEENTDSENNEEEDLGVLDDQRSIILHLLSQLKLGMDLTRVRAHTFLL